METAQILLLLFACAIIAQIVMKYNRGLGIFPDVNMFSSRRRVTREEAANRSSIELSLLKQQRLQGAEKINQKLKMISTY